MNMKKYLILIMLFCWGANMMASNTAIATPNKASTCYTANDNNSRVDTVAKAEYKAFKQKLIDEGWNIVDVVFDGPNEVVIIKSTRITQQKVSQSELEKMFAKYDNVDKSSWERDTDLIDGLWVTGPLSTRTGEEYVYSYLVKDGYILEVRLNGKLIEGCHKLVISH